MCVYEFRRTNCAVLQYFRTPDPPYNLRGIEFDPRDFNIWCTIMQEGAINNEIIKYIGFHPVTGIAEPTGGRYRLPAVSSLTCYPNPFRNSFTISYQLAKETRVRVSVHDAAGRRIADLYPGSQKAGSHTMTINPGSEARQPNSDFVLRPSDFLLGSGVYFVSVQTPTANLCQKLIRF